MSSRRENFARRSANLLPYQAIFDFPIPHCEECGAQMVKLEGQWGCKDCSMIAVHRPTGKVAIGANGKLVSETKMMKVPLGEAYPNRAARRAIRR